MRKALLAGMALPLVIVMLLVLMLTGGSGAATEPVSLIATVEKTLEYAETSSKLGAPWDIVMLTDAIYAMREKEGSIEEVNPIHTSLQFAMMTITVEKWEVVSSTYDPDTDSWDDEYDWVVKGRETYTGKEEIRTELGFQDEALDRMNADSFVAAMNEEMERRSSSTTRYTAELSPNYDFNAVFANYTTLTEEEISRIMELYEADYLMERMDEETQEQVRQVMGEYGMYQYVDLKNYVSCEGVTFTNGSTSVVYYNQLDKRWADAPYGTDKIGTHACGPTAMAIVISSLTNQTVDPVYMANWSYQNGYWAKNKGTAHIMIPNAAEAFGLSVSGCTAAEPQRIVDALANGGLVVALMTRGHFTKSGHFIVLRGVREDGKILVADPSSYSRSQQAWNLSIILNEAHKGAGGGGPFWIIRN